MRRREPKPAGPEAPNQFTALHCDRASIDQLGPVVLGNIVVIAVESTSWDAGGVREGVQLVVGDITHEVTPRPAVPMPPRFVDQNGHVSGPPGLLSAGAGFVSPAASVWESTRVRGRVLPLQLRRQRRSQLLRLRQ